MSYAFQSNAFRFTVQTPVGVRRLGLPRQELSEFRGYMLGKPKDRANRLQWADRSIDPRVAVMVAYDKGFCERMRRRLEPVQTQLREELTAAKKRLEMAEKKRRAIAGEIKKQEEKMRENVRLQQRLSEEGEAGFERFLGWFATQMEPETKEAILKKQVVWTAEWDGIMSWEDMLELNEETREYFREKTDAAIALASSFRAYHDVIGEALERAGLSRKLEIDDLPSSPAEARRYLESFDEKETDGELKMAVDFARRISGWSIPAGTEGIGRVRRTIREWTQKNLNGELLDVKRHHISGHSLAWP